LAIANQFGALPHKATEQKDTYDWLCHHYPQ